MPDNIAHKYSDEYCNVSVVDKEAVLDAAKKIGIDGIMSFACDPGVVTAAYVAEKMGLPFQCSYETACILQDKGRFREFLIDNRFNCPRAKRYEEKYGPFNDIDYFNWPIIIKPTDSAGSKGVSKVDEPNGLNMAIEKAIKESHSGSFIIEEFLTFKGYHSSTDVFTVNGVVKFITFSDQLFDQNADNPYTPTRIIWPSTMSDKNQKYLENEIQRLVKLLDMKTGIYNIETCVDIEDKPYIMEVSPRGGGCKIAEIQKMAYDVDLIEAEIKSAVGLQFKEISKTECDGVWCEMVIHNEEKECGRFLSLEIDSEIQKKYIKMIELQVTKGDFVYPFTGANMALGDMFLRFDSRYELNEVMDNQRHWLDIKLEG